MINNKDVVSNRCDQESWIKNTNEPKLQDWPYRNLVCPNAYNSELKGSLNSMDFSSILIQFKRCTVGCYSDYTINKFLKENPLQLIYTSALTLDEEIDKESHIYI